MSERFLSLAGSCTAQLLSLCILSGAVAQQTTGSILPKDPVVVVELDGPAKLAESFGATNLGELVKSATVQKLLSQFREGLVDSAGDNGESVDHALGMFLDYNGRFRLGAGFFDLANPDYGGYVMFQWFKDEESDFGAWLEFVDEQIELEGSTDRLQDVEVGDMEFRVLIEPRSLVSVPVQFGDSLIQVMLFGPDSEDLEERLNTLLTGDRYVAAPGASKAPISLTGNLEPLLRMLVDKVSAMAEAESEEMNDERAAMAKTIFDAIGIDTFRSIDFSIVPAGKHTVTDFTVRVSGAASILDVLRPATKGRPKLLRYVPRDSQNWSLAPFRLSKIYELAGSLMAGLDSPVSLDDVEGMMAEMTGVDLKAGLLDHIGEEIITIQDVQEASDLDSPSAGLCIGFAMKDGPALDKSIEAILRSRGLHVSRKVKNYRDQKVKSLSIIGPTIYWSVLDEVFLVGIDKTGLSGLHKVIDAVLDVRAGNSPAEFGSRVKRRMAHAPEDWQGCGYTDVSAMLRSLASIAKEDAGMGIPEGVLPMVEGLLKQFDLDLMLSTLSDEDTVLRSRLIW